MANTRQKAKQRRLERKLKKGPSRNEIRKEKYTTMARKKILGKRELSNYVTMYNYVKPRMGDDFNFPSIDSELPSRNEYNVLRTIYRELSDRF